VPGSGGLVALLTFLVAAPAVWAAGEDGFAVPVEVKLLLLNLPAILLGIGLHEWAHAWTAWKLGDSTPEEEGRLSLNPLDHLDPLGTILIIVGLVSNLPVIGWGKPVMISPSSFRKPIEDKMKVALAGPMMNLAIAGFAVIGIHALAFVRYHLATDGGSPFWLNGYQLLMNIVVVNFSLALFNMIPIPPLDGSKVLENFVDADKTLLLRQIEPFGIVIVFALLQTGTLDLPFGWLWAGIRTLMLSPMLSVLYLALALLGWWLFVRSLRWFR